MKRKLLWMLLSFLLVAALVLASCGPKAPGEQEEEEEEEEEPLLFEGQGLAAVTDEAIIFRGWAYKTEIVEDNVNRYNTEMGGNADYATITGDYPTLMEMKLVAGEPLDILYANPTQACRYFAGGWLIPAEDLPNIDAIKADMYPHMVEAWSYEGELLGLSYFISVRGLIHVNLEKYNALGYTQDDMPATWDELYDQLYEFREKGFEYPFLPHWFSEWFGINWAFIFETLNRGGYVADPETHEPMVTVDGPAGDTLRDWKRIWNDGLVPKEVLGYMEPEFLEAWGSGEYIYSPQQIYDLKKFNDPLYSPFAGSCDFVPYQGQSWGLIDSAMYLMSARERSPEHTEDVMRFASWYGWQDHTGATFVGQRWMEESTLLSAYKSVMESPAAEAAIRAAIAIPEKYENLIELYSHTPYPKGTFSVMWAPEFQAWLMELMQEFLVDDLPVDTTIEAIRTKINALNATYGIGE